MLSSTVSGQIFAGVISWHAPENKHRMWRQKAGWDSRLRPGRVAAYEFFSLKEATLVNTNDLARADRPRRSHTFGT